MSKLTEAQEEIYQTLIRYVNAIDRLYQLNEETRKGVIEHFGTTHSPLAQEAVFWMADRARQSFMAQEQKKLDEAKATPKIGAQ